MRLLLLFFGVMLTVLQMRAQPFAGGIVRDKSTGEPIPWAGVLIKGTTQGALTDAGGNFKVRCSQFPITLVITSLGYLTTEFVVNEPDTSKTYLLAPNVKLLGEVVIEANAIKCIQQDSSLMAADVEFYDDFLLLLAHGPGRLSSQLILSDLNGKVVSKLALNKNAEELYRDCLGNVHLLGKDSAWQIFYDYEKLRLIYPNTRAEIERNLYPCKLFYEGRLYLQYWSFHELRCRYFVSESGETKQFYYTCDTANVEYFCEKYDMRYFLSKRRRQEGYLYPVSVIKSNIDLFRSEIILDAQDRTYIRKLNAPMVVSDNSVWVMKYKENNALRFNDSCAVTDSTTLQLNEVNGWSGTIWRDEITGNIYTSAVRNNITTLILLHPVYFTPVQYIEIEKMPFITKMIIRDGYAYFLYIDRHEDVNRLLYRMRLD